MADSGTLLDFELYAADKWTANEMIKDLSMQLNTKGSGKKKETHWIVANDHGLNIE